MKHVYSRKNKLLYYYYYYIKDDDQRRLHGFNVSRHPPSPTLPLDPLLHLLRKYSQDQVLNNFCHFRNGAERSGLFCVALYVAQQIKTQQKVDIFSAVKHIRLYRPQCISNEVRFLTFFWIYSFCFILWLCYFSHKNNRGVWFASTKFIL